MSKGLAIPFNLIQQVWIGPCYVKVWEYRSGGHRRVLAILDFIIHGFDTNGGPAILLRAEIELWPFQAGVESETFN